MSVLIIDKKGEDCELLRDYLHSMGISNIHFTVTTEETLKDLTESPTKAELIIYNYDPSSISKTQLMNCLGLLVELVDIPIILLTPLNDRSIVERAFERGIYDFIPEPIDYLHFKARIHASIKYQNETRLRKNNEYSFQTDLAIAKKIQRHALTPSLCSKNIQFDGINIPTNKLGGDMYSWYQIDENLYAVMLFDVMGHGIASSLVAMSIRSLLKGMMTRLIDPVSVMNELNRHVYELFADEDDMQSFLLTAIYVVIDIKNGQIQYVNAANPHGFIFGKFGEVIKLPSTTTILGLLPTINVHKKTLTLKGWHRIILYTDGLFALSDKNVLSSKLFNPYLTYDNFKALTSFTDDHYLHQRQHNDDITIVSITIDI
ncbi:SpoIIE family protein phosphatase [Robertmurraya andreesenii]|uniref:Sigma-B regulation protein RsbU (Phosphoserine phosphatase) n=1 Tax=Anoxybacillus andreesenii TaxID=1325932 RepID=A0ABT9V394_9BACL|nr:SpoIIE family protein phosphatase [Robertmurraya andreesenii]MDQ0155424.1 sigma-B regulation protein RsbU (phosphoserine phosphatase) [Robertmurraya andreesenii]